MKIGAVTFVLHSHMPFYRGTGHRPLGEESLHEVMADSYLPLLEALTGMYEAGLGARVTLGITPVLAEQLSDALIIGRFEEYLDRRISAATEEVGRFERSGDQHFLYLAHFYLDRYRHALQSFQDRFNGDLVGGFRRLQEADVVEIVTSAATHPYLPLMQRDSTIYAQLRLGKQVTERHFGRSPGAIWLPECAYRPAYYLTASDGTSQQRPGLESALEGARLRLFFGESGAVEGSNVLGRIERETTELLRPRAQTQTELEIDAEDSDVIETEEYEHAGFATTKRMVPFEGTGQAAGAGRGTFDAYYVRDSDVTVLGCNRAAYEQVAGVVGYPGDPQYREFHRKDVAHGFRYWRVTDKRLDIAYKQPYEPYHAGQRAQEQAGHFVLLVERLLRDYAIGHDKPGIIAVCYDTELFGHRWFEGVDWLKKVLAGLAASEHVELTTASAWLEGNLPDMAIDLPESSSGQVASHIAWANAETGWLWNAIHAAERRMEGLVDRYPDARGGTLEALNQAARELVLLEASDWELLYSTGQARQYAADRFSEHVARFQELAGALESPAPDDTLAGLARAYNERDNLFPDIDYRLFARRQPD